MNFFLQTIITLFLLFGLYSCANVKAPTGGPMDTDEPKIRSVFPENFERNFKGGDIVIIFDEKIKTENIHQNFFVSPALTTPPKIKTKKKSVIISIEGPLEDNTTYTLTFKEVIADLNENNTIQLLNYVFSTGENIDSLFIEGIIKNPFTNNPIPDILVGLFEDNPDDTLTFSNSIPKYFAFSDKEGKYTISNVREGRYNLTAIKDDDRNLKYDGGNELIDAIWHLNLDTAITGQNLYPVKIDTLDPVLLRDQPDINKITLEFSEGLINAITKSKNDQRILISKIGENSKNIIVYNTGLYSDSVNLVIETTDSVGNIGTTNVKSIFLPSVNKDTLPDMLINKKPENMKLDYIKPTIDFSFNYPAKISDRKIQTKPQVKWTSSKDSPDSLITNYKIEIQSRLIDSLVVYLPDSMFTSPFTQPSLADTLTFTLINESEVGTIEGTIDSEEDSFILQLLDEKLILIEEKINQKKFKFLSLKAGNYFFRIIVDSNHNCFWDQPDLEKEQRAEEVIFYNDPVKVKENWEVSGIILKF